MVAPGSRWSSSISVEGILSGNNFLKTTPPLERRSTGTSAALMCLHSTRGEEISSSIEIFKPCEILRRISSVGFPLPDSNNAIEARVVPEALASDACESPFRSRRAARFFAMFLPALSLKIAIGYFDNTIVIKMSRSCFCISRRPI